jgi:hypothetical protein
MYDSVSVSVIPAGVGTRGVRLRGGAGADRLSGSVGVDLIAGESGSDTLAGEGGNDTLEGSDGGSARTADDLDGGEGIDTVSYAERRTPVSVTIGGAGNEEKLTSIESVTGGEGDDVLVGDSGNNTLSGGPGKDTLRGGAGADVLKGGGRKTTDRLYGDDGDDQLDGGEGRDRLEGGAGNDDLSLDNRAGTTKCGPGQDTITYARARDLVPADCEEVDLGTFRVFGPPRRVSRTSLRANCKLPADFDPEADDIDRIKLYKGRRLLGRSRHIRRDGRVAIRLNRIGRRQARRGAAIVVGSEFGDFSYSVRIR